MGVVKNLHGTWNYELDYEDSILKDWMKQPLKESKFIIPGTTTSNRVGSPVVVEGALTKEAVRCLREEYKYVGKAYYQRTFTLDSEFDQKRLTLFIERVMFESEVWIDNQLLGKRDSLSVPHVYDITEYVEISREHILTIGIDNRDKQNIGPYPSAYTDETQTIWNGMVGKVEIIGGEESCIRDVIIGLEEEKRLLHLSFLLEEGRQETLVEKGAKNLDIKEIKISETTQQGELIEKSDTINKRDIINKRNINVVLTEEGVIKAEYNLSYEFTKVERAELELQLDKSIEYWDEFSPKLYQMEIVISDAGNGKKLGSWSKPVGFREITTKGRKLYINGTQRFLFGNTDCCVFPFTAHPPMELKPWMDICLTMKEYGLNHIRFHSWCPPEAAFIAADKIGIYLQVEGPMWMDNWSGYAVGTFKEHYSYLPEEAMDIIETYSHHPSFCIFSNGNELNGDFNLMENIISKLKTRNPYLLYTLTTNWDRRINKEDDIFIAQSVDEIGIRGQYFLDDMVRGSLLNFNQGVEKREVPVISHEVGQYVVYPNVNEIPKYKGVLKPVNLESIKKDLEDKDLISYVPEYINASGKLAAFLYKSEMEAALGTDDFSGVQLLSLQDFPGQSTATVGLLDCFYESKGIITSEEFRAFCNNTVLLARMPKYQYKSSENFEFELQIAHYGKKEQEDVNVELKLEREMGSGKELFWSSLASVKQLLIGLNKQVFSFEENIFSGLTGRNHFTLTAQMESDSGVIRNQWDIWVYGEQGEVPAMKNSYTQLNEEAIKKLEAGEKIILFPKADAIKNTREGKFFPVFWSPVHFTSKDPCGMVIDNKHPFFQKYYPVKEYADVEWKNLLENSFSVNIDSIPECKPITMPVPNFFNNHKSTNLLEGKVLNGSLLLCSFDLENTLEDYPEIKSFKRALYDYYTSKDFSPTQEISLPDLMGLFKENSVKEEEEEKSLKVLGTNIAVRKPASSDSEHSTDNGALKGNDGDLASMWMADDTESGHYWIVDLEKEYDIKGTKVTFCEEGNIRYVIHTSLDGAKWTLAVNQTGQTKEDLVREDSFSKRARYVKITYNGLPAGMRAGHREFEVYI